MTSKRNISYKLLIISALLGLFTSCVTIEDPLPGNPKSEYFEFVARPISYNGQTVQTKVTSVDDFENRIHNCYFMLFNNAGQRVVGPVDMNAMFTTQRISRHDLINMLGTEETTCKACFLANIPIDVINGLTTYAAAESTVLNIAYSSVDIEDASHTPNIHSAFVVPEFDLDGDGEQAPVQCMPMFGMSDCDIANESLFQVSLKRLFAKLSVNISMGSSLGALSTASFDLMAAHLYNLPTKVRLVENLANDAESAWVTDPSSFLQQQIEGPIDGESISTRDAYDFYFYVPEYMLQPLAEKDFKGPNGTYATQKYKPLMYDADNDIPVLVKLFGRYKSSATSSERDVTYSLYLGEDSNESFSLKRNIHYKNMVKINGIDNSSDNEGDMLDWRVDVSKLDEVEVIGQTANCYIIGEDGSYIYPACKGVWKKGLKAIPGDRMCSLGETLEIIARDNSSTNITNLNYNAESGEISFDVTNINDGNIVLGLTYMDGNVKKVEWSWHFWFITGLNFGTVSDGIFDINPQQMPNGTSMMMDRNLGANINAANLDLLPGTITGFYYRYGHRAPYFTDSRTNGNGTTYHGYNESDYVSWNDPEDKAITDPCPPGYRVPASGVWSGNATNEHAGTAYNAFRYWNSGTSGFLQELDDIYYPYSGYLDESGKIQSVGDLAEPETLTMDEVRLPHEQNPWGTTITYGDVFRPTYPQRFLGIKYRIHNLHTLGAVSTADEKKFEYSYINKGIEIIECTFQRGTWDSSGSWIKTYTANYTGNKLLINEQKITGEQLKNKYPTQYEDLIRRIEVIRAGGLLQSWLGGFTSEATASADQSLNLSYGYQVRCVKE